MSNTILVGAQWGDEGKGKIIDLLSESVDYVVRFQGGNNAGHTVVVNGKKIVLHLVPSGILHEGKKCLIGNGLVVDPECLLKELDYVKSEGIDIKDRFFISSDCHIILPYHRILDKAKEESKGSKKIGTTGRGIGPCYMDKVGRSGVKLRDLMDPEGFKVLLEELLKERNEIIENIYKLEPLSFDDVYNEYIEYGKKLKEYIADVSVMINDAVNTNKRVLFEGAQGTILDIDHGTYPYVTSSNSTAGGACIGAGIGPSKIDRVIGVIKAYTTRVGEGPFPTEFSSEMDEQIRTKGGEFGATTGRPRRCGWFDAVIGRYAVRVNGLDGVVITKLDVLDELDEINVCVSYKYNGKEITDFPNDAGILNNLEPVYESFPGWNQDTSQIKEYNNLPENAKKYIETLGNMIGTDVDIVSVGSDREATIFLKSREEILGDK